MFKHSFSLDTLYIKEHQLGTGRHGGIAYSLSKRETEIGRQQQILG